MALGAIWLTRRAPADRAFDLPTPADYGCQMLARTRSGLLMCCVLGCGSKAPVPSTGPVANAESSAPAGHDLTCETPNLTFTVTGATLTRSTKPPHKSDGRWNEITGTYKLAAGPVHHEGALVGVRDADFAFVMAQSKTNTSGEVPVVRLTGGAANGTGFILEWTTSPSEQSSASITCEGSLLTAKVADAESGAGSAAP